mgnify:CR=1 FL=1
MRWNESRVYLSHGGIRGKGLLLKRQPRFLRFVITGTDWETLDALDQLGDTPRDGEYVIAAEKRDESSVHFSGYRDGKRAGWWERTATYQSVPDQPPQDVLRDTDRWRAWAAERAAVNPGQGE